MDIGVLFALWSSWVRGKCVGRVRFRWWRLTACLLSMLCGSSLDTMVSSVAFPVPAPFAFMCHNLNVIRESEAVLTWMRGGAQVMFMAGELILYLQV